MIPEIKTIKLVETFSQDINNIKTEKKCNTIDAILLYCAANNIEIENIASLMKGNQAMKAVIAEEAEALHFLPKTKRLPL